MAIQRSLVAAVLMGNLGNQLFQFAAVKGLQEDADEPAALDTRLHATWGRPLERVLRPGSFRELTSRELLALRQTPRVPVGQRKLVKLRDCLVRTPPHRMEQEGFGAAATHLERSAWKVGAFIPRRWATTFQFEEQDRIGFDARSRSIVPPVLIRGFFQSEEYFANRKEHVLGALQPPNERSLDIFRKLEAGRIDPQHLVAVSYRAGPDYRDWALPWSYFRKAAELATNTLGDASFVVFGDTPANSERIVSELSDYGPTTSLVSEDPVTQFGLMQLLPHVVVCNSTFAWWGAWLGDVRRDLDPSRMVMAPSPWIFRHDSIVPARWSTITRELPESSGRGSPRVDSPAEGVNHV